MNQVKAYAQFSSGISLHQVFVGNEVIEVMADGKKEARAIVESYGHKVSFVTCMK